GRAQSVVASAGAIRNHIWHQTRYGASRVATLGRCQRIHLCGPVGRTLTGFVTCIVQVSANRCIYSFLERQAMHGVIANIDHVSGTQGRSLRRLAKRLGLIAAILVIAGAAAWYGWSWWTLGRFMVSTDDSYVGGHSTPISPHIAGFVAEIAVI